MNRFLPAAITALVALLLTPATALLAKDAAKTHRIALIAGRPSHPSGMHEFRAGCLLFQKALAGVPKRGCMRPNHAGANPVLPNSKVERPPASISPWKEATNPNIPTVINR
jgi:hypothetical protein